MRPKGVVLITSNGWRVPIDMKPVEGEHNVWYPLIEGGLDKIMPHVISIDAEIWPEGAHLRIPIGPGYDTHTWARQIIENSPINFGYFSNGVPS